MVELGLDIEADPLPFLILEPKIYLTFFPHGLGFEDLEFDDKGYGNLWP